NRSFGSPFQGSPQDDRLVGLLLKLNYYDQYHLAAAGKAAKSPRKIILQVTQKDMNRFSDIFKDIINSWNEFRAYSGSKDTRIAYLAEAFRFTY
ncbi:MAG: hypothetical protein Q8O01_02020, partial [Candidatus Omnitrophota bacterium]|nr:hypothetical protein [Candidatus Omnitrophota bacterium]